jgi:hypothetical protein
MTCGIVLTESVTSLGKCTKLQLNNKSKVGFGQPCFFEKCEKMCKNLLTRGNICCTIFSRKGVKP